MKSRIFALVACTFTAVTAFAQIGAAKKHDVRVERLLDREGLKYEIDSDGDFKVLYGFDDNRSHYVWINSNTEQYGELEIREVWSLGYISDGQLSEPVLRSLLKRNHTYKLGSWKVQDWSGKEVAVFYAQIAADSEREALVRAMLSVTTAADELEKELTGKDDL